jgi:hypothetical protein
VAASGACDISSAAKVVKTYTAFPLDYLTLGRFELRAVVFMQGIQHAAQLLITDHRVFHARIPHPFSLVFNQRRNIMVKWDVVTLNGNETTLHWNVFIRIPCSTALHIRILRGMKESKRGRRNGHELRKMKGYEFIEKT